MSIIDLGQDLGIESTSELKQQLASHVADSDPVCLDAGQVSRVHTAAMQVLCAFVASRRQAGLETLFDSCSDAFRDAARLLGVLPALGLDVISNNLKSVENAA